MKIQKLMVLVLVLAMVLSLGAFPALADEPAAENVIFICDGAEGDGSSAESPLKPTTGNYVEEGSRPERDQDAALYQAWQKLMAVGGGTIVICGPYTLNNKNCQPIGGASADFLMPIEQHNNDITITYTSVWNGVDYRETNGAELILAGKSHLTFPTATVIQELTIRGTDDNVDHYLCGGMHPLSLLHGTNLIPYEEGSVDTYPMIVGGFRNNNVGFKEGDSHILIDIGDENYVGNVFGIGNGGNGKHNGNSNITIKSGNIGGVYGDSRCVSQVPINGKITIRFEGGIYRGLIAGVNVGFGGPCDKTIDIIITGGDFTNCLGIQVHTTAADAVLPEAVIVDCTNAPAETAAQVSNVCASGVTLKMPEMPTEPPTEPKADPTEPEANPTEPEADPTEPSADLPGDPGADPAPNNIWIYIAVAVAVAAVVVVVVVVAKKKK